MCIKTIIIEPTEICDLEYRQTRICDFVKSISVNLSVRSKYRKKTENLKLVSIFGGSALIYIFHYCSKSPYSVRIQENDGPEKTPYLDTVHAVFQVTTKMWPSASVGNIALCSYLHSYHLSTLSSTFFPTLSLSIH